MRNTLLVILLVLLASSFTGLARTEIECPDLDAYDVAHQREAHFKAMAKAADALDKATDNLEIAVTYLQSRIGYMLMRNDGIWNGSIAREARNLRPYLRTIKKARDMAEDLRSGIVTLRMFSVLYIDLQRKERRIRDLPSLPYLRDDMNR